MSPSVSLHYELLEGSTSPIHVLTSPTSLVQGLSGYLLMEERHEIRKFNNGSQRSGLTGFPDLPRDMEKQLTYTRLLLSCMNYGE